MSNPELGKDPSIEQDQGVESSQNETRKQLEGELRKVENDIKGAQRERDDLMEEFRKVNDAEYSARLSVQRERSVNPQSVDLGILGDAQRANKALAEMYQKRLDQWDHSRDNDLRQRKQDLEGKIRALGA